MKKGTKIWIFLATGLIISGMALFAVVMTVWKWDFSVLETEHYQKVSYSPDEAVERVFIQTEEADIRFALSRDGRCRVELYERVSASHEVIVEDATLTVRQKETDWKGKIGIFTGTPTMTVYLPEREYAALTVEATTGEIELPEGFSWGAISLSLTTGDITAKGLTAGAVTITQSTGELTLQNAALASLTADGSTGEVELRNVLVTGKCRIGRSTGDMTLKSCDAGELEIETSTGSVSGSLRTGKRFDVGSATGNVFVPASDPTGGSCRVRTSTGDITLTVEQ